MQISGFYPVISPNKNNSARNAGLHRYAGQRQSVCKPECQPVRHYPVSFGFDFPKKSPRFLPNDNQLKKSEAYLIVGDKEQKYLALNNLNTMGDSRNIPVVLRYILDKDKKVRYLALRAIESMSFDENFQVEDRRKYVRSLVPMLQHKKAVIRTFAMKILGNIGEIGNPNHIKLATFGLRDKPEVRADAVEAVGKLGVPGNEYHIKLVTDRLKDKYSFVVEAALRAMQNICSPHDVSHIKPCLRHYDEKVRATAVETYGKMSTENDIEALDTIKDMIWFDESPKVQFYAIKALATVGSEEDMDALANIIEYSEGQDPKTENSGKKYDPRVCKIACKAVEKLSRKPAPSER